MKVDFELTGEMPLLMHADDVEAADALTAWRKDPKNKPISKPGDDRSPPWTWQTYLYSDGEHVTIPAGNLMVNLRYAGTQMILKGQKTFKELSQSGMYVADEYLDFWVDGEQIPIDGMDWTASSGGEPDTFADQTEMALENGFKLFTKRAKVGTSKHIRVRPRFDTWSASGTILVTAPAITFAILKQMFDIGGRGGLCDWRPNCKTPGCYGMFSASLRKK